MARYSLLEQPLPPGQTTIREYGRRIGRSPEYIRVEWGARQGFPAPIGQLRPRGRNGGGLGALVYETGALDAFRASQDDLWGIRAVAAVVTDCDLDERVSLGEFAAQVAHEDLELVARYRGLDGFPAGDARGRYRLGDLIGYWNTRPLLITDRDRAERVTLGHFRRSCCREEPQDRHPVPRSAPPGRGRRAVPARRPGGLLELRPARQAGTGGEVQSRVTRPRQPLPPRMAGVRGCPRLHRDAAAFAGWRPGAWRGDSGSGGSQAEQGPFCVPEPAEAAEPAPVPWLAWRQASGLLRFNSQTGVIETTPAELAKLRAQLARAIAAADGD